MFPVSNTDDVIRPKTIVYGVDLGDHSMSITETALRSSDEIIYAAGDRKITITMLADGSVSAVDSGSGESYVATRLFWFAWYTFHPETELLE